MIESSQRQDKQALAKRSLTKPPRGLEVTKLSNKQFLGTNVEVHAGLSRTYLLLTK